MEVMPFGSEPVPTPASHAGKLQTTKTNMVHYPPVQGLEVLVDVSECENFRSERLELVAVTWGSLLEELSAEKRVERKLENTLLELLEKNIAMKAMTLSLVDLERSMTRPELENCLLVMTNEELLSYLSQRTTSSSRITDNFMKNISFLYLIFAFNVERNILKNCARDVSKLVPFIF